MKKFLAILLLSVFCLSILGCATGKATAPGQIKKKTGVNYKSMKK